MKKDRVLHFALIFFCPAFLLMSVGAKETKAQTVWLVCTFDTSSIYKQTNGKEKFERRFYVSGLVSMTKEQFFAFDKTNDRIEGVCGDYLDKTVYKAAVARGERLDASGTLKVIRNIELSGENVGSKNPYNFATKDAIESKRAESIKEAQDANRVIYTFSWDPTYKNLAVDFEKETNRTPSNIAPTTPPRAENTNTPLTPANNVQKQTSQFIFGWARVMTKVQDTDKNFRNEIDRAYYTNVVAFVPSADTNVLKQTVTAFFKQTAIPDAAKRAEKVDVKDVMVKTFPTLYEADNARYAMAKQDDNAFNQSVQTTHVNVEYFNWNFYGGRSDLMPNISEFGSATAPQWYFVIFEVNTSKEVKGEEVHETRYYVSYPFEIYLQSSELARRGKFIDAYFTKTIVEPAKQKGVTLDYYDQDVKVMPFSFSYNTFTEAWAKRAEEIETIKDNGYPQYDFIVQSNGTNKGEGTSFPFCATGCTGERARVTATELTSVQNKKP